MRKYLFYLVLIAAAISCNNDDTSSDVQDEKPFELEGKWYISGSTEGYIEKDTTSYGYNENVLGYQEYYFYRTYKRDVNYHMKFRMRYVKHRTDESDHEFENRILEGNYTKDDLYLSENWWGDEVEWYVNNKEMYTYLSWSSEMNHIDDMYLMAKIVKSSYNQFTVASRTPNLIDLYWEGPPTYNYYITFTRIPD